MLEPVIATLEPARKIEILKSRAKHINKPDWKKASQASVPRPICLSATQYRLPHPGFSEGDTWKFKPVAAAKLLNKLDLENKALEGFPFSDIKAAITTGEAALGAGVSLLQNFARANEERRRRFPRPNG